jgi:hypothetical protein
MHVACFTHVSCQFLHMLKNNLQSHVDERDSGLCLMEMQAEKHTHIMSVSEPARTTGHASHGHAWRTCARDQNYKGESWTASCMYSCATMENTIRTWLKLLPWRFQVIGFQPKDPSPIRTFEEVDEVEMSCQRSKWAIIIIYHVYANLWKHKMS